MCADADLGFHGDAEIAGDHGTLVDLAVNVDGWVTVVNGSGSPLRVLAIVPGL